MKIQISKLDIAASAVFLLFGLYVLSQAWSFGITSDTGPGSGTFPLVAGLLIAVCAGLNLLRGLRREPPLPEEEEAARLPITLGELGKVAAIVALIGVYMTLFPVLGPFLHLPVLMVAISLTIHWRMDPRWLVTITGISLAFTVACYLIFAVFLRVLLPAGPLGF